MNLFICRSLISAIIQSEAAIIAIVISLSLIAVQQTTSAYSARVIDIFKGYRRYPDFFILMLAYIVCIAVSALLLKIIKSQSSVTPFLKYCIWLAYALFIVLLLALIPYISRTLDMFKPSTFSISPTGSENHLSPLRFQTFNRKVF